MEQKEILISQGNRPFWQIILAALFFTGMLICLYFFFNTFNIFESTKKVRNSLNFLTVAIFLFGGGISFSIVRDYHFNFKEKKYKILFCVGPVKIGSWKSFKNLEYISVYRNKKNFFEINLWYDRNRHFNLAIQNKADIALIIGKELAKKLKIELYDATDPHNPKWVDNLKT
ncbi:hypothetical protein LS48_12940 [Aequorivita aquimaris]|uniref:Uncharacterized protein n=1 Tax=Aequorivita aquimaris TaxID=1548749 RepID=A0A137RFB3_9FLAO|nr:hypothetical protein [Aequorivita aquimaris]KXN98162.1 hypothetical protein LS48_12940 [Aequorivita aquimaris]